MDEQRASAALRHAQEVLITVAQPMRRTLTPEQLREVLRLQARAAHQALRDIEAALAEGKTAE